MFQGEHRNNMDEKGRVSIPATFRDSLKRHYDDDRIIITRDFDGGLRGYPPKEWDRVHQDIRKLSRNDPKVRAYERFVVSAATECVPDKQGRILIPPSLRSYAGLDREIVILGMPNRFEIWDRERWDVEVSRFEKEGFEDPELVREIDSLGI